MRRTPAVRLAVGMAIVALFPALVACAGPAHLATPQPDASAMTSQSATASAGASESTAPAAGSNTTASAEAAPAKGKGLSASDAKALDAELTAIESELDRLDAPSDSEFNDISSGLK